jgi:nitrite reductase/ring-hydroxylating ferredoxin subunit/uncharacterized membrane protein
MRSKASIKGHPVHPMLIAFPVAFFTGTFIFDLLSILLSNSDLWQTAYYLEIAGVVSALIAAIPGIIDFIGTVPPKSSAKKRAAQHGIFNVTHVVIFFTAWCLRTTEGIAVTWIVSAELAGVIILSVAGWMGGTLVYRNQIGVDPRYANAGKWKEAWFSEEGTIEVAAKDELEVNQMKLLHINGKRIVLGKTEDGYVAFDDHCTHKGGSLAGGSMICGTVQCPWHGSQFNATTGEVIAGPAEQNISTYKIAERNGKVYLEP